MDVVILAAGYGTRLYPLTEGTPKPLLKVANKLIIEHIIEKINELEINKVYIITNDKFVRHFTAWLSNYDAKKSIEIVNDNTTCNDDRLGAIGDVQFLIKNKKIQDDILVIAGDNLFEFSLKELTNLFNEKKSNIIVLYDVKDRELAKNYGVVSIKNSILSSFEEKPKQPSSTLVSAGIYTFPKRTLPLIKKYIDQGNNTDKSGSFIEWLYKREQVYCYMADKEWYDIGSFEQLDKANRHFTTL